MHLHRPGLVIEGDGFGLRPGFAAGSPMLRCGGPEIPLCGCSTDLPMSVRLPNLRVIWHNEQLNRGTLRLERLPVVRRWVMLPLLLQRLRLHPFGLRRLMSLLLLRLLGLRRLPNSLLLLLLPPSPQWLRVSSLLLLGSLGRFKLQGILSLLLLLLLLVLCGMLRWRIGPRACCRSCICLRLRRSAPPEPDRCRNGADGAGPQPPRNGSAVASGCVLAARRAARCLCGGCKNASPRHTAIVE